MARALPAALLSVARLATLSPEREADRKGSERAADPAPAEEVTEPAAASAVYESTLDLTRPLPFIAPRRLGESDLVVYPMALGGSVFGWTADGNASLRILDRYHELGGNFIDTADNYAGGRSEVLIGTWMRQHSNRERVVIATKVGRHLDSPGLGPVSIIRAVESSLERLGTDYIDLLYFHDEDPEVPLEDSLATVEWLIERGKVRYLAASNFSADRLMEARILSSTGLPKFIGIQTQYNLVHRIGFESDLRILASAQNLAVMPYQALAGGFLTGKYRSKDDLGLTVRGSKAGEHLNRRGHKVLTALDRVAGEHNVPPATIAIAWLLAKRNVVAPVASASDPDQVDVLMDAAKIRLTRAQMLELDRVSE
jgi:aryl-alcohol dehydrogenase-like predicted oxidoreductase